MKLLISFCGVNFRSSFSVYFSEGISFHLSALEGSEKVLFRLFLILSELLVLPYNIIIISDRSAPQMHRLFSGAIMQDLRLFLEKTLEERYQMEEKVLCKSPIL